MKILLMQPLIKFMNEPPRIPDLGLAYIASSLKKKFPNIWVLDWNQYMDERKFETSLIEFHPDVTGIKIFTKDVYAAKKTITIIKRVLPSAIIVLGGPHPSCTDKDELMGDFSACDFAIKGEAEYSFLSLIFEIDESLKKGNKEIILIISDFGEANIYAIIQSYRNVWLSITFRYNLSIFMTIHLHNSYRSPAERLNKFRYHETWLHNLLISASSGGLRTPPQNPT